MDRITVLHTVPPSTTTTNPFVNLMISNLPSDIESTWFSWSAALRGHFDVIHFQWPEKLVHADNPLKGLAKRMALGVVLELAHRRHSAIVVTIHNLDSHEGSSRAEQRALKRLYARTSSFITLNSEGSILPITRKTPVVIPHGDYRQTYEAPESPGTPTRASFFGLIRGYKNVPALVSAFLAANDNEELTLAVVGKPWNDRLANEVTISAKDSPSVTLRLEELEEKDLVSEISESGLVILPYRNLYNSGAVFLALTLARPVLVPSTDTTRALQLEFGPEWVVLYEGSISPEAINSAMSGVAAGTIGRGMPDLSGRDWKIIGERYGELYREVTSLSKN